MGTTTTNLGLYKPAVNETGWGTLVDGNFDTIDTVGNTTVLYVTTDGDDANVGKHPAKPKLTLQSAITALGSGGGRIYVGPGTFTQSAQIGPAVPNIEIVGVRGQTVLLSSTTDLNIFRLQAGASGWTFRGLTFDGANISDAGVCSNDTVDDLLIEDCTFQNFVTVGGAAIHPLGISHLRVSRCYFVNCQTGVLVNSNHQMDDIEIVDNHFDMSAQTGDACSIASLNSGIVTERVRIIGNEFIGGQFCVECQSSSGGIMRGVSIVGNSFQVVNTSGTDYGAISLATVVDSTVSGNTIDGGDITLGLGIELADSDRVAVTGNSLYGMGGCLAPITLENSRNCSISGNVINGFANTSAAASNQCILLLGSTGGVARDNIVIGNTCLLSTTGQGMGILVHSTGTGNADRNAIIGNVMRGNGITTSRGIDIVNEGATVDRTLVDGNLISNCSTAMRQYSDTNTTLGTNLTT